MNLCFLSLLTQQSYPPEDAWIDNGTSSNLGIPESMAAHADQQMMLMNGAQIGKLTMMEYAMLYFRNAPVKFEVTRNTDGTLKSTVKTTERKSEWHTSC